MANQGQQHPQQPWSSKNNDVSGKIVSGAGEDPCSSSANGSAGRHSSIDLDLDAAVEILSQSPLHRATQERDLSEVRALLKGKGAAAMLEERDFFGLTPFMKACLCGDVEMVRYLVEKGANIHATDSEGRNALHFAVLNVSSGVISYLVRDRGLDVNSLDASRRSPVYIAASNGKVEALRELMALRADPGITDSQGLAPIEVVCEKTSGHQRRAAILDLLQATEERAQDESPPEAPKPLMPMSETVVEETAGTDTKAARADQKEEEKEQLAPHQCHQQQQHHSSVQGSDDAVDNGYVQEHFGQVASLLDKLRVDFATLGEARASAMKQMDSGHLGQFITEADERLQHVVQDAVAHDLPMPEAPMLRALDELAGAHAGLDAAQEQVREMSKHVPEDHVESNTVLVHNHALAQATTVRDERRTILHQALVSFFDLCRPDRLQLLVAETDALLVDLASVLGLDQLENQAKGKQDGEVLAACRRCLALIDEWEKQVRLNVEEQRALTTGARDDMSEALLTAVNLLGTSNTITSSRAQLSQASSGPPLDQALMAFANQICRESHMLKKLQSGADVRPPFPRDALLEACRMIRGHLFQRAESLKHVAARIPVWEAVRANVLPFVGKSSSTVAVEFLEANSKMKEALLRVEDEIIDKNYEKAKIHNAQRRKGASSARAHEAKANQEALDELRAEKRTATKARKEFLHFWLKQKEDHFPELPLPKADLLGAFHGNLSLSEPVIKLFSPGRTFTDYTITGAGAAAGRHTVNAIRCEVHRAEYSVGEVCSLKVFPSLRLNAKAFMREVTLRFKLQSADVPIVPLEAVFTEDDHDGTGYLHMHYYEQDLATWARTKPRTVEQVAAVFYKVLEAVEGIHQLGIVHGDLKAESFLMDDRELPRLAEFLDCASSSARQATHDQETADQELSMSIGNSSSSNWRSVCFLYMAPELKSGRLPEASPECDMYSCGVLLRKLLEQQHGAPPAPGHAGHDEAGALRSLASSLCCENPAYRPTASQAMASL